MKKLVALTMVGTLAVAGTVFASSVPVTDFNADELKANVEYSFHNTVKDSSDSVNGYSVAAQYGINDELAGQFGYTRYSKDGEHLGITELNGVYNVADYANVYAGISRLSGIADDHGLGFQAGVIGYMPVTDKVEAFAKVGVGTKNIKRAFQLGATYKISDKFDVHAYYEHDRFKVHSEAVGLHGYNVGVGYKF